MLRCDHLSGSWRRGGNKVRLKSPEYVRPDVKAQKHDDRDAEATAEASLCTTMRFVPVKSEMQSDLQSFHRARERLVAERATLISHLRGVLRERGMIIVQGRNLAKELPGIPRGCGAGHKRSHCQLISDLRGEWHA